VPSDFSKGFHKFAVEISIFLYIAHFWCYYHDLLKVIVGIPGTVPVSDVTCFLVKPRLRFYFPVVRFDISEIMLNWIESTFFEYFQVGSIPSSVIGHGTAHLLAGCSSSGFTTSPEVRSSIWQVSNWNDFVANFIFFLRC